MGFTTASHLSYYSALAEVVAGAFGGKSEGSDKGPITEDLSVLPPEQMAARVNQMLSL